MSRNFKTEFILIIMANTKNPESTPIVEESTNSPEALFVKNKNAIIGAVIAIIVIIGGYFAYQELYQVPVKKKPPLP